MKLKEKSMRNQQNVTAMNLEAQQNIEQRKISANEQNNTQHNRNELVSIFAKHLLGPNLGAIASIINRGQ